MHHYCILSLVAGQLGERELILVQVFDLLEVCLDFSNQNDFKALASLNSFFKKNCLKLEVTSMLHTIAI